MDYNKIREGATLYLPVFQIGALLFVGDGHAAQGDGELTGDALETSMDIEFTIDLLPDSSTGMPRAENTDYIMASGIAGSLQEALQTATSELMKWVSKDYKLNPSEAAIVLGTAIQYDVAELVDPQFHVVAKLAKPALATLTKVP
jgi:acetamidase/formamidase